MISEDDRAPERSSYAHRTSSFCVASTYSALSRWNNKITAPATITRTSSNMKAFFFLLIPKLLPRHKAPNAIPPSGSTPVRMSKCGSIIKSFLSIFPRRGSGGNPPASPVRKEILIYPNGELLEILVGQTVVFF